jgi:dynein light chain 4, axonemal
MLSATATLAGSVVSLVLFGLASSQHSDMLEEIRSEAMDMCVTAAEKFPNNNEVRPAPCAAYGPALTTAAPIWGLLAQSAARMIKETMDKKYGPSWHAVVGESYGFEINYEVKNILYMFCGGNLGVLLWKSS